MLILDEQAVSFNEPAAVNLTRDFAERLRQEIVAGTRAPGSRLVLDVLKADFGISLSPIREGLARLVAEGFVVTEGQRGFRVSRLSRTNFAEIFGLRRTLELSGLRQAIEKGDDAWEGDILAKLHRLNKFEKTRWSADHIAEWEQHHRAFHRALLAGCGSQLLLNFCNVLHDLGDRYRRVCLVAHEPDRNVPREHEAIAAACIERRADEACALLQNHIERTSATVFEVLDHHELATQARRPRPGGKAPAMDAAEPSS